MWPSQPGRVYCADNSCRSLSRLGVTFPIAASTHYNNHYAPHQEINNIYTKNLLKFKSLKSTSVRSLLLLTCHRSLLATAAVCRSDLARRKKFKREFSHSSIVMS